MMKWSKEVKGFIAAICLAVGFFALYEAKNAYWVVTKTIRAVEKLHSVVAKDPKTGQVFTYEEVLDAIILQKLQEGGK